MTFRLRHLLAALILHASLVALLVTSAQCSREPQRPTIIGAVLLDASRQQVQQQKQQAQQQKQREDEQRRQEQARKDAQEKQKQKQQQEEAQRKAAADQKRQQAEAQRKKLEDAQHQKELAGQKKAEEQARKKKEQQEARERQEQAQRARQDELQDKARMEDEMRQETARRDVERAAQAQAATQREQKLAEWSDALERHIQKFWNRPASATGDFKCQVRVQLLPDGTVTSAKTVTSCGSEPLDRSVEDAAYRASPLPKPADPSVFDRDLIINFEP